MGGGKGGEANPTREAKEKLKRVQSLDVEEDDGVSVTIAADKM